MKRIMTVLAVMAIVAAGCSGSKFAGVEKTITGDWQSTYDNSTLRFGADHTMKITAFNTVFETMKWQVTGASADGNRLMVKFYDVTDTQEGKRFDDKYKAYKPEEGQPPVKYPGTYTYMITKEGTIQVYDEKGGVADTLVRQ